MAENNVRMDVRDLGGNRYRISATARFAAGADRVWDLLSDWQRFVHVGLPGMTSEFTWLNGGPGQAPSRFQFLIAGATLKEEIYELAREPGTGRRVLRYRALEPALGVMEYDATLTLQPADDQHTDFDAVREVRLAPGTPPGMLAGMIRAETQCLADHFSR